MGEKGRWAALTGLALAWLMMAGCPQQGAEPAEDLQGECLSSTLIAQCPPGSNPALGALAEASCQGAQGGVVNDEEGRSLGSCAGVASCQVFCQFASPCPCGVAMVSRDAVICRDDCPEEAGCGNGVCDAGENPANCTIDCGPACAAGERRCNDRALEECDLQGRFESLQCPNGEVCDAEQGPPACRRVDIIVDNDAGMGPDGGEVTPDGRVLLGEVEYPVEGAGEFVRGGSWEEYAQVGGFTYDNGRRSALSDAVGYAGNYIDDPNGQVGRRVNSKWVPLAGGDGALHLGMVGALRVSGAGEVIAPAQAEAITQARYCEVMQAHCPLQHNQGVPEGAFCLEHYDNMLARYGANAVNCTEGTMAAGGCFSIIFGLEPQCLILSTVERYPEAVDRMSDNLVFSPNGRFVVDLGGARQDIIRVIELGTWRVFESAPVGVYTRSADPQHYTFAARDSRLVVRLNSGQEALLVVWDFEAGSQEVIFPHTNGAYGRFELSPNGLILGMLHNTDERGVEIRDVARDARIMTIYPPDRATFRGGGVFGGSIQFSPRGDTVALVLGRVFGSDVEQVEIWDLAAAEKRRALALNLQEQIIGVSWSPNGASMLITANNRDNTLEITASVWGVDEGVRRGAFAGVPAEPLFNPDGSAFVMRPVLSSARDVAIWARRR